MFHCNGWCFPLGGDGDRRRPPLPAARSSRALIWRHMRESGVTHFCAAPTVLTMTIWDPQAGKDKLPRPVRIGTGGAPPTPALLERLAELGMDITHLYGLTETYGPCVVCEWRSEWDALAHPGAGAAEVAPGRRQRRLGQRPRRRRRRRRRARRRGDDGRDRDPRQQRHARLLHATRKRPRKACPDGWFRTGDLGVMFPDGYIELRDRAKDIIISGGENISSVEIESALASAPGGARGRGRRRGGREVGRGAGRVRRAARGRRLPPLPN